MNARRFAPTIVALALVLTACGGAVSQQEPPTPTPLPPDPALEKPTYTVRRGPIERQLEITGKVTPVDLVALSFRIDGKIEALGIRRGDQVKAGDVLARLQQDDAMDELRTAEDAVAAAERELETARKGQAREIRDRERALAQAEEALAELLPGGEEDVVRKAQKDLEEAQRTLRNTRDDQADAKVAAERALRDSAEALKDAQKAYSDAWWDWDWVQRKGTDPDEPFIPDPNDPTKKIPNELTDEQIAEFREALNDAEIALKDAEAAVPETQQALDKVRETEILEIQKAEEDLAKKQRALDKILQGSGSAELQDAQEAVEQARSALEETREGSAINDRLKALENAQRDLEKQRKKVEDGQLIAPRDGEVLSVSAAEGDQVIAFDPIIEIADPTNLEFSAQLSGEQVRQVAEGQPAEIRLLTRPDVPLPAIIRKLPGGSASGGTVEDRDPTTRFEVTDTKGLELRPTEIGRIRIVLERKESVLLLAAEAVRSFEGRRFVVVREGEGDAARERRATVRVGIETDTDVEILEGLDEGDVVVGQ